MLQRGDLLPHFAVTTLDGGVMTYSTIWQRKNLVLVILPGAALDLRSRAYVSQLNILWLPTSEELIDWIRYVENQCPECEGEAK
jgi:hypothetical protein